MITQEVIEDIYRNYHKLCKDVEDLRLPYYVEMLSPYHKIRIDGEMVIVESVQSSSPFHQFLTRALCGVLEFDRVVAMVFQTHIIFFSKREGKIAVNFKPIKHKKSWKERLYGLLKRDGDK